jgi:hypothetical protein
MHEQALENRTEPEHADTNEGIEEGIIVVADATTERSTRVTNKVEVIVVEEMSVCTEVTSMTVVTGTPTVSTTVVNLVVVAVTSISVVAVTSSTVVAVTSTVVVAAMSMISVVVASIRAVAVSPIVVVAVSSMIVVVVTSITVVAVV